MSQKYNPTTWKTGDIVSSTRLNKMEKGIEEANNVFPVLDSSKVGQVLTVVQSGENTFEYDTTTITSSVQSVNGKTGEVNLTATDVGALSDSVVIPTKTSDLTNDSNFTVNGITSINGITGSSVNLTAADIGAISSDVTIPTKTSQLTNDSNFASVSDIHVQSVNGKTGSVELTATDVNALPNTTTIPTKTSQLTNDSGFTANAVTQVNGQTGNVTLTASDVGAISSSTTIPTKTSDLTNDSNFVTSNDISTQLATKQNTLVSGSNIKTINNESILGSGNINISGSSGSTLIVNLTEEHDSDYLFSSDKTFNNVLNALNSGIIPVFRIHLDSNYFNYYFINEINHDGDKYYLYINGRPFRYVCDASNSELDENMNFKLENEPV